MYRDFITTTETVKEPEPKSKIFKKKSWTEFQSVMSGFSMVQREKGNVSVIKR